MTILNKIKTLFRKWSDSCTGLAGRIYSCSPGLIVWISFSLIMLYTVLAMLLNYVSFRDSSEYVAIIEDFKNGAYDRAFPKHLPVLYTVLAGVIAKTSLLSPCLSLWLVSGIFAALSVFPLYGILKKCVPGKWASLGALLFATFPYFVKNNVAPLTDSARTFFFLFSLYLIFSNWKKYNILRLIILGISFACLTLGRAEGILLTGTLCIVYIAKIFSGMRCGFGRKAAYACACVTLPLLLVLVISYPRMKQMYDMTGYPAIDSRQSNVIRSLVRELSSAQGQPENKQQQLVSYEDNGGEGFVTSDVKVYFRQGRFFHAMFRSLYYPLLPFMLFGIFLWIKRKRYGVYFKLLLLSFVLHNLVFFVLRAAIARYLLCNAAIMMPFTLLGCRGVWLYVKKRCSAYSNAIILLAILFPVISGIYSLGYIVEADHEYVKNVGEGLRCSNAGVNRPVVLTLGGDRGIGYYSGVNVVRYEKYSLNMQRPVDDIIQNGVESRYVFFWHGREIPDKLNIDAMIIDRKNHPDAVKGYEHLFEPPQQYGRLSVYKVRERAGRAL